MSTVTKDFKAGSWPAFVTTDDLTRVEALQAELARLQRHKERFTYHLVLEELRTARERYLKSPTDSHFHDLTRLSLEMAALDESRYLATRTVVGQAIRSFFEVEFVPFARAILARGLARARKQLSAVEEDEKNRYREMTGDALNQEETPIIKKARGPVREIEAMLALVGSARTNVEHPVNVFAAWLRKRKNGCSEVS